MAAFLIYLAKSGVAMAVFYLFYLLFFRQSKQFRFLRAYLLLSMLISFVIPLISITLPKPVRSETGFNLLQTGQATTEEITAMAAFTTEQLLFFVFCTGFALLLGKFLIANVKVLTLIQKSCICQLQGVNYRISKSDIHPFSFFGYIVIPDRLLQSPHLPVVLMHEQIHADEQHSMDVLLAELLFLFQWFNPFAWLMKSAIRNNLGFLTDNRVIHHVERQRYQLAMVAVADKKGIAPFLTALNGSQLKSRIIMMKKTTKPGRQLLRKLLIVPIMTVLVLTLSNKKFEAAPVFQDAKQANLLATPDSVLRIEGSGQPTGIQPKPIYIIDGKELESIDGIAPEDIESVSVFKNETAIELYGERGKNGVVSIQTKQGKNLLNPGGAKTDSTRNLTKRAIQIRKTGDLPDATARPLIVIDGENKGTSDVNNLNLNPDDIESIDVINTPESTKPFGDEGKNGVILITTKKGKQ
ncbi:MAG: M56 family metallopeptidase [Mangrovibacterium sp.]